MNIQHSSRSDAWETPDHILDKVKRVLGRIDLDPASSSKANKRVQAIQFQTASFDSLNTEWFGADTSLGIGTIFLNPPGGKIGNQSKVALFWKQLMMYRDLGLIDHAIFLAFSLEALQVTQGKQCKPIAEFPFCVPMSRIKFLGEDNSKQQPSHSNMIVYVPGLQNETELFTEVFSSLGRVLNTKRHP